MENWNTFRDYTSVSSIPPVNMTSKSTQRVYPVYVPPPITVVVHDPLPSEFREQVTKAADAKFAQAFADFATDFSQAVTLSFAKLPTTIQDIDETVEDYSKLAKPTTHDRLSLAEMGLSGYKTQKEVTITNTRTPTTIADTAALHQV